MVMQGYLDDPQATSAMVDGDGWLRTGDIGRFDRSGHLYIVDRLKVLIKVNAFQVAPAELEAVLLSHPSISDAAVVGVPDDVTGEAPVAFVVLSPDARDLTVEEVLEHVASRVATYKRLRSVTFVDTIPKSASGKILRRLLTDAELDASSRR
jgi:acyl-CoA synthetase (AMP-forming)/AMP-acid ligase II